MNISRYIISKGGVVALAVSVQGAELCEKCHCHAGAANLPPHIEFTVTGTSTETPTVQITHLIK